MALFSFACPLLRQLVRRVMLANNSLVRAVLFIAIGVLFGSCGTFLLTSIFTSKSNSEVAFEQAQNNSKIDDPGILRADGMLDYNPVNLSLQLRKLFAERSPFHRRTKQLSLLDSLADNLLPSVLEDFGIFASTLTTAEQHELLNLFVAVSAKKDAVATFTAIAAMDTQYYEPALSVLFKEWVRDDVNQARAQVNNMDERFRFDAMRTELRTNFELTLPERNAIEQRLSFAELTIEMFISALEQDRRFNDVDVLYETLQFIESGKLSPAHDIMTSVAARWVLTTDLSDLSVFANQLDHLKISTDNFDGILAVLARLIPRKVFLLVSRKADKESQLIQNLAFKQWLAKNPLDAYEALKTLPNETQSRLLVDSMVTEQHGYGEVTWYERRKRDIETNSALEMLTLVEPQLALQWIEQTVDDATRKREIEYAILDELVRIDPRSAINMSSSYIQGRESYKVIDTLLHIDVNLAVELLPLFQQEKRHLIYARVARELLLQGQIHQAFDLGAGLLEPDGSTNAQNEVFNLLIAIEWYRFDNLGFVNGIKNIDVPEQQLSVLISEVLLRSHKRLPPTNTDLKQLMSLMNPSDIQRIKNANWFSTVEDL
ncbi:MAG: hypothetical protein OXG88_05415 [Gammaproteobacteria bacterium]|nr:hypothetical protein [Gammaproteobacteria bacterium]